MLRSLHISNYILIDSLDVSFPGGLVIITGQTGAGKSVLLGALSLLTGARADASVIRDGADNCVVEAEFEVDDPEVRAPLGEDVEWDGGRLVVRRVVYASGRSRSFVNDSPVSLGVLSGMASRLVDVHSQHQSLLLTDRSYQLSVLDAYASAGELLAECGTLYRRSQELRSELSSLDGRLARLAAQRDYTQSRYERLEQARLRAGELEELEAEQKILSGAEEIRGTLSALEELDSPSGEGMMGVSASLKEARRLLDRSARYLPAAGELSQRLESVRIEVEDIFSEAASLASRVDVSEGRLEAVEERMALLYDLMHKYSCTTVEELIAQRDALGAELFDSSALDERRGQAAAELTSVEERLADCATRLHAAREAAAAPFAREITESLRYLELERAAFEVRLSDAPVSASGRDAVSFLFDASGARPVDVASCASGGELSRIMLCLKALMARYAQMPTMIFDEIDTGVSGSVAARMGSMICTMGGYMQVIAITHLPQVAAKGGAHLLVTKSIEEGSQTTSIRRIDGDDRVREIARMLSGTTITPAALDNARDLLGQQ